MKGKGLIQGVLKWDELIVECNENKKKMPIINVRIHENNRWKRKAKNKDRKEQKSDESYS